MLEQNISDNLQGKPPVIDFPNDADLIRQFSNRKYKMSSKGKIELERKEDMKKRGLQSPDIADSVALAFYEPNIIEVNLFEGGI